MFRGRLACAMGLILLTSVTMYMSVGLGEIPRKINYQGRLLDPTGAPLAGSHSLTFRIFDTSVGGSALWTESQTVTADSTGVFAVILGAVDSLGIAFDGLRWLEVEVGGEILAPRREMVSVPFAFHAIDAYTLAGMHTDAFADSSHRHSSLDAADGDPAGAVFVDDAGNVGVGTLTPAAKLDVAGTAKMAGFALPTDAASGRVLTSDASGAGTWQVPQASPDGDWAVWTNNIYSAVPGNVGIGVTSPGHKLTVTDTSSAPGRTAICGTITANTDGGRAVYGETYSGATTVQSVGVLGVSLSHVGGGEGTVGISLGPTGRGIEGTALDASGVNYGVYGQTLSSNGYAGYFVGGRNYFQGKVGIGIDSPRYTLHVVNPSSAESSMAICGHVPGSSPAFDAIGVYGRTDATTQLRGGAGVAGGATSPDGSSSGVQGTAAGIYGAALAGYATHATGANYGVRAYTASPNGYAGFFIGGRNYFQGNVGIGTDNPGYPLVVTRSSLPDSAVAIYGGCDSYSGKNCGGVWGLTASIEQQVPSYGVRGSALNYHGCGRGVLGEAYADSGVAVYAAADHHTGVNFGIRAYTNSPNGYAGHFSGGRNFFSGRVGIGNWNWDPANLLHVAGVGTSAGGVAGYPEVVGHFRRTDAGHTAISVDAILNDDAIIYLAEDGQAVWDLRNDSDAPDRFALRYQGGTGQNKTYLTVANDGKVGIGTTAPGYLLQVGSAGDGSQARANAWNLLSSREYKKDIEPLGPAQCRDILEKATSTAVVRYTFTNDPAGVEHLGVIAEESPSEIVASDGKGVSLGDYAAFLLAAIKAQQAEIEELRNQVKELQLEVEARR
jgi:hypothetical protein